MFNPVNPMIVRGIPVTQSLVFPTGKYRYPKFWISTKRVIMINMYFKVNGLLKFMKISTSVMNAKNAIVKLK
jgi:hypothetical protein